MIVTLKSSSDKDRPSGDAVGFSTWKILELFYFRIEKNEFLLYQSST